MTRVWKPIDVNGLRLYRVHLTYPNHPAWNCDRIVAARSPSHAAELIADIYHTHEPIITGHALDIFQPKEWTE